MYRLSLETKSYFTVQQHSIFLHLGNYPFIFKIIMNAKVVQKFQAPLGKSTP